MWRNEPPNFRFSSTPLPLATPEARQLLTMMKDFNLHLNLGKSRNIPVFTRLLISLMWIPPLFIDESMEVFRLLSLMNSNNCCQLLKKQHSIYTTHISRNKGTIQ